MVRGIDKFREFFTGYEGNYVIIGGTACEMHEEIYAQTPRATKDIDIILIVEALSSDFAAKFWEFVKTAGYRQRNKGTGNGECRHEYYRFKEPGNPDFPYQIELFSRNIGVVKFPDDAHITPIPVDDDLSKIVETNDQWIRSRTGIGERRIATDDSTSDMAAKAAARAIEQAGIDPEEIDLIILATSSPDYCFPNGACEVQAKVGAVNAACFDISSACTGFVFALSTAHAYISSGLYKTALVIGADLLSKLVDWTDRSTCVLFGDGAGAAVVTAAENGIIGLNMHSNGAKGGVLTCGSRSTGNFLLGKKPELGYMTMEGQEVFKFAVKQVPECIKEVLEETGNTAEDIDQFIIHQANYRIIESIAKRLKVDLEKFPVNMEHYGNTSGASVPILLDELNRAGKLKNGDKLVLAGFGAGLTWGAVLLEW